MGSKRYRNRKPKENNERNNSTNNPRYYWDKPSGRIIIGVIIGVIILIIGIIFKHYFSPDHLEGISIKGNKIENCGGGIKVEGTHPTLDIEGNEMKNIRGKAVDINNSPKKPN